MSYGAMIKAGFMGFALAVGGLMLVFFVAGTLFKATERAFSKVFLVGGIVTFLLVSVFLQYRLQVSPDFAHPVIGAACIGGWLAGLISGATQLKIFLRRFLLPR